MNTLPMHVIGFTRLLHMKNSQCVIENWFNTPNICMYMYYACTYCTPSVIQPLII